ncbi:MAG TPA: hypothetical protein VF532_01045 [Candidatus Angelobacter sp.]
MRQGTLDEEGISNLLRVGPVIFAVADVGLALRWIDPGERYQFWKEEVKAHLAASDCASLDGYPDGYYYFASHWSSKEESATIVLLEKCH